MMEISDIKFDCKYFKGTVPCVPNKKRGKVCECDEYTPISKKILIIKLAALGDVIRTTPLVVRFRKLYPNCHITWVTQYVDILPKDNIDLIVNFEFKAIFEITNNIYDIAINLDKDFEACSLLYQVNAKKKFGFTLQDGHIDLANAAAKHKLITGLFDQESIRNKKSYLEEIFEICEMKFEKEPYLLPVNQTFYEKWKLLAEKAQGKKIIGLNTGCGARWPTRLWRPENWIELIKKLKEKNLFPIVVGGKDEDEQNKIYAKETGVYYPGTYGLEEYISMLKHCDMIVSAVSMSMHIAIGLQKKLILFNNIFNKHEFELYGAGEIVEPPTGCDCFYGQTCKRENHCMDDIKVDRVFNAIISNLN